MQLASRYLIMNILRIICICSVFINMTALSCFAQSKAGDIICKTGFERANELRTLGAEQHKGVRLAPGFQSPHSLMVEKSAGDSGPATVHVPLPVDKIRGARLSCSAMIRAEGVTRPPQPWNGVKFMLHVSTPGGEIWRQKDGVFGTFDWKRVQFRAIVPPDATSAELIVGLEAVNGRAQFDDITITVATGPRERPAKPLAGQLFKGHDEPRFRGAMISPDIRPENLRVLGQEWNANLVRWQLIRKGASAAITDEADYDAWLEGELRKLDAALPLCEKYGMRVVLDLHSPFAGNPSVIGYASTGTGLFVNKAAQEKFVSVWQRIAHRYKDSTVIWGYDLANEPEEEEVADGCDDWQALATRTARTVRAIDSRHAIIVEPAPWGRPASLEHMTPIPVPGVIYSVHMYAPEQFTHQGVNGAATGLMYPGSIQGKMWDKAALRRVLQPVRDWQRDYGAQIYIGEFSAIRWAPEDSAYRYLRDCIELFEEYGWDWSYHAFREWDGWSVEHGPDMHNPLPANKPTNREIQLRSWFEKNAKPVN